ncbi:aminotransferase class III-fold pyridoxal phosphate-dependent enzyme [Umezawaea tangerina]|uniref:Glutamate-1-semialdehyde 2,1-aminomutase n=1 Tax=Umezawaea tangerina TaxID=84725 RepID=A0A2T0T4C4_9PSEU|nr:aminotransferase class III-fold pyridoxal phosphate-dependent enzyme [Umezawaea tangerina]PRY40483.1 glutamate-1-semialdehyde 2,1-aminomutase [Umezawaea tangerina]
MSIDAHPRYTESRKLLERGRRVIPHGIWGHNRIPSSYDPDAMPWFADRAEGARMRDVDGNWYIDYICGYGAMINGYARPEIDAAVREQSAKGSTLSHATARSIELAETLVDLVPEMTWTSWGNSGSDATWSALVIARAHTGRSLVACVEGAYHGMHGWGGLSNPPGGRIADDVQSVRSIRWNDIADLDRLFTAHGDQLAAVVVTPFHHPMADEAILPDRAWINALHAHCERAGTLLISDDVRAGFRLALSGSHTVFGFRPDLVCFSKGLGNGWPLAAVLGTERLRSAAESVFVAGTFWNSASSMAAAITNIRILREEDGVEKMRRSGESLSSGLLALSERLGAPLRVTGPPAMPTVTAKGDHDLTWRRRFAVHMAEQGVLIHLSHNWALSTAHDAETVEETLAHAEVALQRTLEEVELPTAM